MPNEFFDGLFNLGGRRGLLSCNESSNILKELEIHSFRWTVMLSFLHLVKGVHMSLTAGSNYLGSLWVVSNTDDRGALIRQHVRLTRLCPYQSY